MIYSPDSHPGTLLALLATRNSLKVDKCSDISLTTLLTTTELQDDPDNGSKSDPAERNGKYIKTSPKVDAENADTAEVLLGQDANDGVIAAGLGLPSVGSATVVFPLSERVQGLLQAQAPEMSIQSPSLWTKLYQLIDTGEIIWQNGPRGGVSVLKCSADIVVKMIPNFEDFTEYTALQYLRKHVPEIPVPTPMGVIISDKCAYIFMSFVPGPTLEEVWSGLPKEQKVSLSNQLSLLLLKLRDLKIPQAGLFGGIGGEGCKDSRRHTRISEKPIRSIGEFEDFIFSNPTFGGSVYIKLLRSMSQNHTSRIVFTHGDLRPANIVVLSDAEGNYSINGILDWEMSGFYPEYWESVKATNTMAPQEEDDWYLHLPPCASPTNYPIHWLLDRKWDVHVA